MRPTLDVERRRRAALLPPNAACVACGETDPLVLEVTPTGVLCADDAAINGRCDPVDSHHLAGRRWPIVLNLSPNVHRIVTVLQRPHQREDPIAVALLRGFADLMYVTADFLERRKKVL